MWNPSCGIAGGGWIAFAENLMLVRHHLERDRVRKTTREN
jgi:hypothetical protein